LTSNGIKTAASLAQASTGNFAGYTTRVRLIETSEKDFAFVARTCYGHSNAH